MENLYRGRTDAAAVYRRGSGRDVYKRPFERLPQLVYVVAALVGMGEGLYWLSINSLNQIVSTAKTRSLFISDIGIFNNLSAIIAPLISTFIIELAGTDTAG